MKNKILESIKNFAIKQMQGAYQQADVAEDEKSALVTCHDGRGNRLSIQFADDPEYQKQKR